MINGSALYLEIYKDFYKYCNTNNVLPEEAIPCISDDSLTSLAQYENSKIRINEDKIDDNQNFVNAVYHELTHYLDELNFIKQGYSSEEIDTLMLTFSEMHASYNGLMAFLGFRNLNVKARIDKSKVVHKGHTLTQLIAFEITKNTYRIDPSALKRSMYFLGERKAMMQICSDVLAISKAFSYNKINPIIKNEVIGIDKATGNQFTYQDLNILEISVLKLQAEVNLTKYSTEALFATKTNDDCVNAILTDIIEDAKHKFLQY